MPKFFQEEYRTIRNCKETCKVFTDGLLTFVMLDQHLFDYKSESEGGRVAGGIGVRQERQTCFFSAVDSIPLPPIRVESTEENSFQITTETVAQSLLLV